MKIKPTFATRVIRASIHTDTKLGCDSLCSIAEAIAPGFTHCVKQRIESRVNSDWESDMMWKDRAFSCFRKPRYALFIHSFLLWIAVRLVERHDPFSYSHGDRVKSLRH